MDKLSETIVDIVNDVTEVFPHHVLRSLGILEFHSCELEKWLFDSVGNNGPGDFLIALGGLGNGLLGALEVLDDALHHADSLLKRAVVIVF